MAHTNKSWNEPFHHLYSPLHIVTTILHTRLPMTDQSLSLSQTCHHRTPHFVSWSRSWQPFISFCHKRCKLHGTECGVYNRCGEMARSNCSIVCMAIKNFKENFCHIIFWGLLLCAGKWSSCIFLNRTNNCMNLRWVWKKIYMEQLEKQQFGRTTGRSNNNSTMYITNTGYEGQSWLELAQNIQWWVLSVGMKLWDFLHI